MIPHKDPHQDRLGRLIGRAGKVMKQRLTRNMHLSGFEFAPEQLILLAIVQSLEGVNQQTLTEFFGHDKTATTRNIDVLEDKKLVVRVPDKEDRRQNMIFLTDMGRETLATWLPVVDKTEQEALQGISQQDIQICKEVLRKVTENLSNCSDTKG
jgi:DNA-binding MarR family transcriptional regulator